jgi:hypothetical protein
MVIVSLQPDVAFGLKNALGPRTKSPGMTVIGRTRSLD